ncbi:unnamed protein product [Prunus armeniaca]
MRSCHLGSSSICIKSGCSSSCMLGWLRCSIGMERRNWVSSVDPMLASMFACAFSARGTCWMAKVEMPSITLGLCQGTRSSLGVLPSTSQRAMPRTLPRSIYAQLLHVSKFIRFGGGGLVCSRTFLVFVDQLLFLGRWSEF